MRFSSLVSVLLVAAWGCARTSAAPPRAPTPAPASRGSAAFGGAVQGGSSASVASSTLFALDPSEAITPRELASIPDPIPAGDPAAPSRSARPAAGGPEIPSGAPRAAPSIDAAGANPRSAPAGANPRSAPAGGGRGGIWRVQVFASPDLAQANRIAKEASSRFGASAVIEFEDDLYKVRLGAFASEALAQSLRERAVQEGFPGAFRMRSAEP